MDTREKIVPLDSLAALLETGQWMAVVGLFDPLTAIEARRLADLARRDERKLLAIVLNANDVLLPPDARAALVAALREVRLVAIAEPGRWRSAIPDGARVEIVEDPGGDQARSAEFIQFVLDRQRAAAAAGRND